MEKWKYNEYRYFWERGGNLERDTLSFRCASGQRCLVMICSFRCDSFKLNVIMELEHDFHNDALDCFRDLLSLISLINHFQAPACKIYPPSTATVCPFKY